MDAVLLGLHLIYGQNEPPGMMRLWSLISNWAGVQGIGKEEERGLIVASCPFGTVCADAGVSERYGQRETEDRSVQPHLTPFTIPCLSLAGMQPAQP